MANPLVLIVPINLSINKPVYGRFLGNRFWNANDRQRLSGSAEGAGGETAIQLISDV